MNTVPNFIFNFLRHQGHPGAPPEADDADFEAVARNRERRESFGRIAPKPTVPAPYDTPDPEGRCWIIGLPEEVLVKVFKGLDGVSLARCMRVCKTLNDLLTTNPHLALQNLLSFSSLRLNPNALIPSPTDPHLSPPSPAELLAKLRDRLNRFARLDPKKTVSMRLQESEGRLYEYLEGILMRSVGPRFRLVQSVGLYDLRGVGAVQAALAASAEGGDVAQGEGEGGAGVDEEVMAVDDDDDDEWDDVEEGDDIVAKVRRTKNFGFTIAEFAVDPGQDLLVLVEVAPAPSRNYQIKFHLLSLATLEAHPLAQQPVIDWPVTVSRSTINLAFQICDDGLYVLSHGLRSDPTDQLCGWQWTTGRLAVVHKAFPTMTFESFILLSPNSFVIPTIITHLDPTSANHNDLTDASDLSWTAHLHLYAFPPLSSVPMPSSTSEPFPPPHSVTHIATFDLPSFYVDLEDETPPPRMTIRTDPPPRHTFPSHPVDAIQPFAPTPESGVIILEFLCQLPDQHFPRFVLVCPKKAVIQYLPAPTSPLLTQAWPRQAPVIKWETLAPKVRMFGPDMIASSWVCYVYQDRYAASTSSRRDPDDPLDYNAKVRLYDFNPLRVKKEALRRGYRFPTSTPSAGSSTHNVTPAKRRSGSSSSAHPTNLPTPVASVDGEQDGVTLITRETVLKKQSPLMDEVCTGSEFPYIFVEKEKQAEIWMLDDERLIGVYTADLEGRAESDKPRIEVMEF